LSAYCGNAYGAGAISEGQAFDTKTPLCRNIVRVDFPAFMLELQFAFPQELQLWWPICARTSSIPPVQQRCGDLCVEHLQLSSTGWSEGR
jgi:hypothetical protein